MCSSKQHQKITKLLIYQLLILGPPATSSSGAAVTAVMNHHANSIWDPSPHTLFSDLWDAALEQTEPSRLYSLIRGGLRKCGTEGSRNKIHLTGNDYILWVLFLQHGRVNTFPFHSEKGCWAARETPDAGTVIMQCHQLFASGTHIVWVLVLSTKMTEKNNKNWTTHQDFISERKFSNLNTIFCYKSQGRCFLCKKPDIWGQVLTVESSGGSSSSTCAICWGQLQSCCWHREQTSILRQQTTSDSQVVPLLWTTIDVK